MTVGSDVKVRERERERENVGRRDSATAFTHLSTGQDPT